jgi:hypothetical protein
VIAALDPARGSRSTRRVGVEVVRMTTGAVVAALLGACFGLIGGAAAPEPTTVISRELLDAAVARGAVRVIVMLTVPDDADAAAIAATKQALWSDLAGTTYRVLRDLPAFAAVVLEASPDALRALGRSARVEHVAEENPRPPQR